MEKIEIDAYDIIIDVNSLEYLPNGWDVKYSEAGIDRYNEYKTKLGCVVGVLGLINKGKSFLLQKVTGIDLPCGYNVRTEGLSVKYPDMRDKNIIILDTVGMNNSLKESNYYNPDEKMKEIEEEEEEEKRYEKEEKGMYEKEDMSEERIEWKKKQEEEEKNMKVIERFAKDKQITELFLQKFVMKYSNIILLVVDQISYTEQIMIDRIKTQCDDQKLIIVHNLKTLIYKKQIEDYIEDTLMSSFLLKKERFNKVGEITNEDKTNNYYYIEEIYKEEIFSLDDEEDNDNLQIIHLIMGKDNSEAGNYYNKSAINMIQNIISGCSDLNTFDVIDKLIKFTVKSSEALFGWRMGNNDIIFEDRLIKTNDDIRVKINPKLGPEDFNLENTNSDYIPKYRFYKNIDFTRFVIEVELAGKIEGMKLNVKRIQGYIYFKLTGKKSFFVPKNSFSFISIPRGFFNLEIKIPLEKLSLKSLKVKEKRKENGVYFFEFELNPKIDTVISDKDIE